MFLPSAMSLYEAILENSFTDAKNAIVSGINVNEVVGDDFTQKNRHTLLYLAAFKGNKKIVQLLLDNGALVDQQVADGSTPLIAACQQGNVAVVKLLLMYQASVNKADDDGETPIFAAALTGHKEVVSLLLDNGAPVNSTNNNPNGATPLYVACQNGQIHVVELLLTRGANVNQSRKTDSYSPLHVAAYGGHLAIVKLLMKCGADTNCHNKEGLTPSSLALEGDRTDVYTLLASTMTYQQIFIAEVNYILYKSKKAFPIDSSEWTYIDKLSSAVKNISNADEFFKKISIPLKDVSSSSYHAIQLEITPLRKIIIVAMNKYNESKLGQSLAEIGEKAPEAQSSGLPRLT